MDRLLTIRMTEKDSVSQNIDVTILPNPRADDSNSGDLVEIYKSLCRRERDPFILFRLDKLPRSYKIWEHHLKQVRPFYAVKANNDLPTMKILASLGCGFDCASRGEIERVLSLGVSPLDIIYAHPCKDPEDIRYAASVGVQLSVFDNESELYKMADLAVSSSLLVRLSIENPLSDIQMGMKFDISVHEACHLIDVAKRLKLSVTGVCFHIGNCVDYTVYQKAIKMAREVFDYAKGVHGMQMTILNLGGGFPGEEGSLEKFSQISKSINEAISTYFSDVVGLKVMAEPGRYFATSICTTFAKVISRRQIGDNGRKEFRYYLNDGLFGSYLAQVYFFHKKLELIPLLLNKKDKKEDLFHVNRCRSTVFGNYLAPDDILATNLMLPELDVGDWMYCKEMGSYTTVCATSFHSFLRPKVKYAVSDDCIDEVSTLLKKPLCGEVCDYDSEVSYICFS